MSRVLLTKSVATIGLRYGHYPSTSVINLCQSFDLIGRGKAAAVCWVDDKVEGGAGEFASPRSRGMAEARVVNDQELAIICDLVDGWDTKWGGELNDNKRQALDQLIANGFVELAEAGSLTRYKHTAKASRLLAELCVGISGG